MYKDIKMNTKIKNNLYTISLGLIIVIIVAYSLFQLALVTSCWVEIKTETTTKDREKTHIRTALKNERVFFCK